MSSFLKWLGRGVYGGFVPIERADLGGAENYLPDLWKQAPWFVSFTHTLLAVFVQFFTPLLIFRVGLFSTLSAFERNRVQEKLFNSRIFVFRMIAYGVRGHAFVAIFRIESVRKKYFENADATQGQIYWREKQNGMSKPTTSLWDPGLPEPQSP